MPLYLLCYVDSDLIGHIVQLAMRRNSCSTCSQNVDFRCSLRETIDTENAGVSTDASPPRNVLRGSTWSGGAATPRCSCHLLEQGNKNNHMQSLDVSMLAQIQKLD